MVKLSDATIPSELNQRLKKRSLNTKHPTRYENDNEIVEKREEVCNQCVTISAAPCRTKCLIVSLIHAVLLLSIVSIAEPSSSNDHAIPSVSRTTTIPKDDNSPAASTSVKQNTELLDELQKSSLHTKVPTTAKDTNDVWFEEDDSLNSPDDSLFRSVEKDDDDIEEILYNNGTNTEFNYKNGVLIVATVDGTLAGLCKSTGQMVWKRSPNKQFTKVGNSQRDILLGGIENRDSELKHGTTSSHQSDSNDSESSSLSSNSIHSFDPLVYTTSTKTSSRNDRWRTVAVPSILDGKVYLTAADDFVTTTAKELVALSPFADHRGRIYTGSSITSAVAIDADTGEIVQKVDGTINGVLSKPVDQATSHHGSKLDADNQQQNKKQNIIWMGRLDHTVTISESGHIDVQFTSSELMSPADLFLGSGGDAHRRQQHSAISDVELGKEEQSRKYLPSMSNEQQQDQRPNTEKFGGEGAQRIDPNNILNKDESLFVAITPNGHLAYLENETRDIRWVTQESFDTPVAFCMDSVSGRSCEVETVPDAILSDTTPEHVSNHFRRHLALKKRDNKRMDQSHQMKVEYQYTHKNDGTPVDDDDTMYSDDEDEPTNVFGSLPGSGQLYAMPLGLKRRQTSLRLPSSSVTQAKWRHQQQHNQQRTDIARLQTQHANFYPNPTSTHIHRHGYGSFDAYDYHQNPCTSSHSNFPHCLSNTFRSKQNIHPDSRKPGFDYLQSRTHVTNPKKVTESAIVPFYQYPEYGNDGQRIMDFNIYNSINQNTQYENDLQVEIHRLRKNHYWQAWRQWLLHPAFTVLFVVAIELGRRKRQMDNDSEKLKKESLGNKLSNEQLLLQLRQRTPEPLIQVDEEAILGFGGHGTVVYRGLLDGREVAVKRMLKTYHASADREISLLIESDGHPNVVRYFLKEVRSEFVYLALELCDLSLHDLVGILKFRNDTMTVSENEAMELSPVQNDVLKSVKDILLQIAIGVRHLHHLRIVHRDLKPANILLADTQKSKSKLKRCSDGEAMFEVFKKGYLVAKISDMGLGKQLVGQSSYGASQTNSSLRMQSHGAVSSVVGARGTVGWQAPEVMALRGTTDSSVRSETSNRFTGDSTESASPHECNGRTSRSVDIFSLGCVFYTTLVPGSHPFGEWYEREANIMHDRIDMQPLRSISMEAYDLIGSMLSRNPKLRPNAKEVCEHPYFWEQDRKLSFLCEVSDRIEMDSTNEQVSSLLLHVERGASNVVGLDWRQDLDDDLVNNVQRFRSYNTSSVRDLLRLIRNKHHHFEELPKILKESFVSSVGLVAYFEVRFPKLLVHVYSVVRDSVVIDDVLARKYAIKCNVKQKENVGKYLKEDGKGILLGSGFQCHPMTSLLEIDLVDESLDPNDQFVTSNVANSSVDCINELSTGKADDSVSKDCDNGQPDASTVILDYTAEAKDTTSDNMCRTIPLIQSQGWYINEHSWTTGVCARRDQNLLKCLEDNKFRTRLCNHWDLSFGTVCPLKKKNKCIFAHGPIELRVKEGKRSRWGKLVDADGNCKNPNHSGGEDTYGVARSVETERKEEGKWNTKKSNNQGKKNNVKSKKTAGSISNGTSTTASIPT